jgi:hypothetical protein
LREAFTPTPDGRLRYPEIVFAAPKKSGKTATAALATLYVTVCLSGRFGEAYCLANSQEQAQSRVFQAVARIIEASPLLRGIAKVTSDRIEFRSTGATIAALPADYTGAAGSNPTLSVFDELWAYTSERSIRLWDEMVPPPTRKIAARLTVTYAGFEGESTLLEGLYKRGLQGRGDRAGTIPAERFAHGLASRTRRSLADAGVDRADARAAPAERFSPADRESVR